jgi:tetratricopeptide (TPR) repeat protein
MRLHVVLPAILALAGSACASERGSRGVASMQPPSAGDADSGWRYYRAGERLVESGKTQDAAVEFRKAEEAFGDKYLVERSMAIYGRARALDLAGRCTEAQDIYHQYADFVADREPASAKAALRVAATCRQVPADDAGLTTVALSLRDGDYGGALSLVERIEPSSRLGDAWRNYNRAEALVGLHRTEEALASFETAAVRFAEAGEGDRGRPLVAWAKGRALVAAGRCAEAQRAFESYARLVRERDPQSAAMATDYARSCTEVESSSR